MEKFETELKNNRESCNEKALSHLDRLSVIEKAHELSAKRNPVKTTVNTLSRNLRRFGH